MSMAHGYIFTYAQKYFFWPSYGGGGGRPFCPPMDPPPLGPQRARAQCRPPVVDLDVEEGDEPPNVIQQVFS